MLPGDRLVCAFTRGHEAGEEFSSWYLHLTIVPWFRLDASSGEIAAGLTGRLLDIEPFEVRMGGIEFFGRRQKRVNLVQEPTPLHEVEARVRSYFHEHQAWLVDETTRRPRRFRPHVTAQGIKHLSSGNVFLCDRLCIVEQLGGVKRIGAVVTIGGRASF